MNYLAHALLAGDAPPLVVGGVVGDWIKGHLPGPLPGDLARGVALHRAIDAFAETHPAFRRSRSRVSPARRRYAGVLVDIFYDHLLARDWATIHHEPLGGYCAGIYGHIAGRLDDIPESAHHALGLMAREDWLQSYAGLDGIADVLARMSRRARQPNPLAGGEGEFLADPAGFAADFRAWLPDAVRFAGQWLTPPADR
ncbi:MAG TPA: ACP phosphodiesterase [Rhodocyclaceae bacterium]|nr:ACP phosphodiesterase [Rhodocyclaceae bacterium]